VVSYPVWCDCLARYEAHQFEISTDTLSAGWNPGGTTVQITFDRAAMLAGKPAAFTVAPPKAPEPVFRRS
jgi:hypothetical protein